jgi:hypothetical protein
MFHLNKLAETVISFLLMIYCFFLAYYWVYFIKSLLNNAAANQQTLKLINILNIQAKILYSWYQISFHWSTVTLTFFRAGLLLLKSEPLIANPFEPLRLSKMPLFFFLWCIVLNWEVSCFCDQFLRSKCISSRLRNF